MMRYLLFFFLVLPLIANAETELDRQIKSIGLVDSKYKVIDQKRYDEFWRNVTKEVAQTMPIDLDAESRILSTTISKNAYTMFTQFDTDIENDFDIDGMYAEISKKNFCNSNYGKSRVIKVNGGLIVSVVVMNRNYQTIYNLSFSTLDC